jgi:hypothetical protein
VLSSFRAKLFGIVLVAAMGFIVMIGTGSAVGARIEHELALIRDRHVPRLELGPRLTQDFEALRLGLQNAVAAQDADGLAATAELHA